MRLRFGNCTFDTETGDLLREGRPVHLSAKAAALLRALLARRPQPATMDQLASAVWPENPAARNNLGGLLLELRGAIEGKGEKEVFRRTSSPDGYAFVAEAVEDRRPVVPGVGYRYCLYWDDREIPLEVGENVIGRDCNVHFRIDEGDVSRRHARIVVDGDCVTLEDMGSSNGTFLNERRLEEPVALSDKDRITVGPVHLIFRARVSG